MTLQAALAFLGEARRDEALRSALEALGDEVSFEALVGLGASSGFHFTPEELQRAHALDWQMRWARYHGGDRSSGGAAA